MDTEGNTLIPTPSQEELKPTVLYMSHFVRLSKVMSMWPETKLRKSFLFHLRVWMAVTYFVLMVSSLGIRIAENINHLNSISVLVDFTTVFASGIFRYIYIYVRADKYLLLISMIHNNFIQCSLFPKKNRASSLIYYKIANRLTFAYSAFVVFWVLQICMSPVVSYIWKMSKLPSGLNETLVESIEYPVIMKAYAPFDYYEQPYNAVFYVFQFCAFMTMCWVYVLVDCFWYTVVLLSIGQFVMLKDSVKTISEILSQGDWTELQPLRGTELQSVREGLKHCIRQHQFLRKFVCLLEDLNSPVILVDTIHVLISVAFMMVDVLVAINIGDWNRAIYSFEYFITAIIHMFCFDWLGNELAVKEQEVADAIHTIPWYKCPTEKSLLMIMSLQARRPYKLTGGRGMFTLSLEFFTNTGKAIFSIFTFLLNMIDR